MDNDKNNIHPELQSIQNSLAKINQKLHQSLSQAGDASQSIFNKVKKVNELKKHVQKRNVGGILGMLGGWRYRKIIKILPGVHLNLTRQGVSVTLGKHPLSVNIGKKGIFANEDIPGTHLWKRKRIFNDSKSLEDNNHLVPPPLPKDNV